MIASPRKPLSVCMLACVVGCFGGPVLPGAAQAQADATAKTIRLAMRLYMEDKRQAPANVAVLVPQYLATMPNDLWGRPLLVTISQTSVTVTCLGADGRAGGTGVNADIVATCKE